MTLHKKENQLLIRHHLVISKRLTRLSTPPVTLQLMIIFWWHVSLILGYWLHSLPSLYHIFQTLPSDESIMEFMSLEEMSYKHHHHQSSFLPSYHMVEDHFETMVSSNIVTTPQSSVLIHIVESEGNLSNVTLTIPIDISVKPGFVENIYLGQNCSASKLRSYTTLFKEFRYIFAWTYE